MPLSDLPRAPRKNNDPKQLGYWKLGRILGQGASGRVRIARHAKTGQMAAIKIIPKNLLTSRAEGLNLAAAEAERHEQSLQREVVLMKLIEHPNIMRLYDVWDLPDELFLVLEYVQGGELLEYLSKTIDAGQKSIPLSQALSYFQQIIIAVSYCHRFNVSHRDLKLENILVDSDNNIKIADFGLASFQPDSIVRTACGSLHYCAPEVVTGYGNYNGPMADVWSCGIILFALLTCSLPFNPENDDDLKDEILHAQVPFPDDIHPDAQDLISRMLTKDVQKRITMSQVQKHPFFLMEKPKIIYGGIPSLEQIAMPLKSVQNIDRELLRSLQTLGREASDEQLKESLVSSDMNWQKGAYHLLFEYRRKRLEEYDEQVAEIERKRMKKEARARVEASRTAKAQEKEIGPSPSLIPPRDGPPTPSRRERYPKTFPSSPSSIPSRDGPPTPRTAARGRTLGPTSAASSDASFVPVTRPSHLVPSSFSEDEIKPSDEVDAASSCNTLKPPAPSSLPLPLPSIAIPETDDPKVQAFYNQVLEHLTVLHSRTGDTSGASVGVSPAHPDEVTSPNLALMQEIFKDRVMIGGSASSSTPLVLSSSANVVARLAQSGPRRSVSPPLPMRLPTRPLSLKRKESSKPRRPKISITTKFDSSNAGADKENIDAGAGDGLTINTAAEIVKKSSLRKGFGTDVGDRANVHPSKRVQIIVDPPPFEPQEAGKVGPSKLKKKRSLRNRNKPTSPAPSSASSYTSSYVSSFLSSSSPSSSRSPSPGEYLTPTSTGSSGWFSSLLKFSKPLVYTLHSAHAAYTTRNECRRLLMEMDPRMRVALEDAEGLGVLKCKLDQVRDRDRTETVPSSALKALKFKVTVHLRQAELQAQTRDWNQNQQQVFLILTHEKGSAESFKEICSRLRREWVLDDAESRTPEQVLPLSLNRETKWLESLSPA